MSTITPFNRSQSPIPSLTKNETIYKHSFNKTSSSSNKNNANKHIQLLPNPIMNLSYILGFTSTICPKIHFSKTNEQDHTYHLNKRKYNSYKKHFFFCSGPTLVKFDPEKLRQQFYFGHSLPITNYTFACNDEIIFSCQEGPNALIKISHANDPKKDAINLLSTPYDHITVLSENKTSKHLCTVGTIHNNTNNNYNTVIIIWDITDLSNVNVYIQKKVSISIHQMMFSPYEANVLVSVGHENVKFWRIINSSKGIGYKSVVLQHYAKGVDFLSIAFSKCMMGDEFATDKGKVYIGASNGCVFQIACSNQELEAVYKVQDKGILSMKVSEAFCVTGSVDGYLRVWPIDFTKFLIEAKHDAGVCSVDLSFDNFEVLCGTLNGSVGLLNIQTKQYKTIIRSPPLQIQHMIAHPSGDFLFTIENNNSVRVWDIEHKSEAFQFLSLRDPPCALAAPKSFSFACGFSSGIIKVFDLEKIEILYECKPFKSKVKALCFILRDSYLIAMSVQGNMSIHDSNNKYMQCKILNIDPITGAYSDLSLCVEKDFFATIGPESKCALIWECESFITKNKVQLKEIIMKICLIHKNLLTVLFENCSIRFYSLASFHGIPIKEIKNIHINSINNFIVSKNYKYFISGGYEGMIKIWDFKMSYKRQLSSQKFIGHSNSISSIVLIEKKSLLVSTSQYSGIYFWNFLGNTTQTENEIAKALERFGDVDYASRSTILNNNNTLTLSEANFTKKAKQHMQQTLNANTTSNIRMKQMEKVYKTKKGGQQEVSYVNDSECNNNNNTHDNNLTSTNLLMLPVLEDKSSIEINYTNNNTIPVTIDNIDKYTTVNCDNIEINECLYNKLFYKERYCPYVLNKYVLPCKENESDLITMQYVLGMNTNSMNNLVYNYDEWYAYTVNNKIVIESLFSNGDRMQRILINSKDELSCLYLTSDKRFLISGVGFARREKYAALYVYDVKNAFALVKKMNCHNKGVQCVKVSNSGKYLVSVGIKEDNVVCLWKFKEFKVIDSKIVNDVKGYFDVVMYETNTNVYFATIASDVVSLWSVNDVNNKLEVKNVRYDDIVIEGIQGEMFMSIEIIVSNNIIHTPSTPLSSVSLNNNNNACVYLIGTNKGNIYCVDSNMKLIHKLMISKFPLTHLYHSVNTFICCGEGLIVFYWTNIQNTSNPLSFFTSIKPNLAFMDSPVISLSISSSPLTTQHTALLMTNQSSLYILNFKSKQNLKIFSSHIQCNIPSLTTDTSNINLLSCGTDGTIRCYTTDTFDMKFQINSQPDKNTNTNSNTNITTPSIHPNKTIINETDSILLSQYNMSYLRIHNLTSLLNLGIIKIKDINITVFDLLFYEQSILISTQQDQLYLIDVKNWDPLSLLYSALYPIPSTIPKNQLCKCLCCKDINREKAYAITAYSNGTVITFLIEKIKNKIEVTTIDTFNVIETFLMKNDDVNIKQMFMNNNNKRCDYTCKAVFSKLYDGISLCVHECLQVLYIRNYIRNEMIKVINVNYYPITIDLSNDEKRISLGTKDGVVLVISKKGESFLSGYTVDSVYGCYDMVMDVKFSGDNSKLYASSYNEVIVFNIN